MSDLLIGELEEMEKADFTPFRLAFNPGDVLVLHTDKRILSESEMKHLQHQFKNLFPENRVIVLENITVAGVLHHE